MKYSSSYTQPPRWMLYLRPHASAVTIPNLLQDAKAIQNMSVVYMRELG